MNHISQLEIVADSVNPCGPSASFADGPFIFKGGQLCQNCTTSYIGDRYIRTYSKASVRIQETYINPIDLFFITNPGESSK